MLHRPAPNSPAATHLPHSRPQALRVRNVEVRKMKNRIGYNTRLDHRVSAHIRHPRSAEVRVPEDTPTAQNSSSS